MSVYEYISIVIAITGIVVVPLLILLYRIIVKWTRTESLLTQIASDIREDRAATNNRITWLEHTLWAMKK